MFRIDNATATGSIPTPEAVGPNPDSFFTEGDPGLAVPATVVTADWLNAVQEEICNVIEEAGDTLDKADRTQLKAAIETMIAAALTAQSPLPLKFLSGLTLSNNSGDAAKDIDIAAGVCRDATDAFNIELASALGKQIDAAWAEGGTPGTTAGGFPSGLSLTNGTWYRVFVIAKADGTVDGGFDTSATAANLLADATGYTYYRHVGWVFYTSNSIVKFFQKKNRFTFDVPRLDVNYIATTTTAATHTVSLPPDVDCVGDQQIVMKDDNAAGANQSCYGLITAIEQTDTTPSASAHNIYTYDTSGDNNESFMTQMNVASSASSTIRSRFDTTSKLLAIITCGWIDTEL